MRVLLDTDNRGARDTGRGRRDKTAKIVQLKDTLVHSIDGEITFSVFDSLLKAPPLFAVFSQSTIYFIQPSRRLCGPNKGTHHPGSPGAVAITVDGQQHPSAPWLNTNHTWATLLQKAAHSDEGLQEFRYHRIGREKGLIAT